MNAPSNPIKIKSIVLIVLNFKRTRQVTTPARYIKLTGALCPLNILSDINPAQIVPAIPTNGSELNFIAASSSELLFAS